MHCLSKQDFKRPVALVKEMVDLPEWGDGAYVWVQGMGANDLLGLQDNIATMGHGKVLCELLAVSLVDDEGAKLFTSADDVKAHFGCSLELMERLGEVALRVSGVKQKN